MKLQNIASSAISYFQSAFSSPTRRKDFNNLMEDQFGFGWMDRLEVITADLTPDRVQRVLNNASSRSMGDLGALYSLMYKVSLDLRIGGMLEKRTEAVQMSSWYVESGNSDNPLANEAAEFLEKWIDSIRFKHLLSEGLDGKLYGVKLFQNVIRYSEPYYFLDDPEELAIPHARLGQGTGLDDNQVNRWGELYIKSSSESLDVLNRSRLWIDDPAFVHPLKLMRFINRNKRGFYDTTGLLYRTLVMYIVKVYAVRFAMQQAERHGKPFLYSLLPDADFRDPEYKGLMSMLLRNFAANRWGVFKEGTNLQALDSMNSASTSLYMDLINLANTELAIGILGQNLSTEVKGGSFAAAASHAGMEEKKTIQDCEFLEEGFNDQFARVLTWLNFPGLSLDDYPKLNLQARRAVDLVKFGTGVRSISESIDVPVDWIHEESQIPKPRRKNDGSFDELVVGPSTRRRSLFSELSEGN